MENKEVIQFIEEQREQIKRGTGQLVTVLKVGTIEERQNPSTFLLDG